MVLGEARRTFAGESSDGVHTQKLTVVLFALTLIQISAALAVLLQDVSSGTGTEVASLCVFTDEVTRLRSLHTLIHIHTQGASDICGVSSFTHTAVGAQAVDTLSVHTQVPHHTTLIYVFAVCCVSRPQWTHLLVVCGPR